MRHSDSLPLVPPHFVVLRSAVPLSPVFVPTGRVAPGARSGSRRPHRRTSWWKRQGLPGSWGALEYMPRSTTPAGPSYPVQLRLEGVAFRGFQGVGSRNFPTFRGSITRPALALSTLRTGHCWPSRKTRFRLGDRPCRTGLSPAGRLHEVSGAGSCLHLPPRPSLPGARKPRVSPKAVASPEVPRCFPIVPDRRLPTRARH